MLETARSRPPRARGVFCNRTLNMRGIRAIGYDMDYTLVHYRVDAWERQAYRYLQQKLLQRGWPVAGLEYIPGFAIRGLVIDRARGNIVKPDRFGYVKRASHGTRRLDFDEQRRTYARTLVDLADRRWAFLNTFFSLSEACMYAQLVDLVDRQAVTEVRGYAELHDLVVQSLDDAHAEGRLKQEIVERPDDFVEPDPDIPLTLLDQREAGKRLLLITNSGWPYTRAMMAHCFDPWLPDGMTWRDLFDVVIVSSRKPLFFSTRSPLLEVVDDNGLLREATGGFRKGTVFYGGSAEAVQEYLGLSGAEILYVGDHLYTDVRVTKDILRWRTVLIVRELEEELAALDAFREQQGQLNALMDEKASVEFALSQVRLDLQRLARGYAEAPALPREALEARLASLRGEIERLDRDIAPLASTLGGLFNANWGLLMRAGGDKSHMARQIERYADIYTSRVSNLAYETPFAYLRAPRGALPHDPVEWSRPTVQAPTAADGE